MVNCRQKILQNKSLGKKLNLKYIIQLELCLLLPMVN
nr:MAG TPA: hypothetical protein [Bacteriophage sp.]